MEFPGEEWSMTEAARDIGTMSCFGAFTDRDDDRQYWSATSGVEIMSAEILYVLAVNTDPISTLDIFHAVLHKVWTVPAAVTSKGWPSLPTYSQFGDALYGTVGIRSDRDAADMEVWVKN